jgi:hypothetical protein
LIEAAIGAARSHVFDGGNRGIEQNARFRRSLEPAAESRSEMPTM